MAYKGVGKSVNFISKFYVLDKIDQKHLLRSVKYCIGELNVLIRTLKREACS